MEEVETEVENMECLEDPGLEDTENLTDEKEDDPDWHCQMEDKGDDDIDDMILTPTMKGRKIHR